MYILYYKGLTTYYLHSGSWLSKHIAHYTKPHVLIDTECLAYMNEIL